ncbi:MAG: lipocalin family protein [Bacteroidales bacterium]|jgi:apolipoprotein D and lipocalin family protein
MKKTIGFLGLISIFGCKTNQPLQTVANVDLNKYLGKWYEIAAFPQYFERGCSCVTAVYSVSEKKYITVLNSAYKAEEKKNTSIKGKAFIVKESGCAKLKVQFFWPFKGNYWIIDLADDYSYAVVGDPKRKSLWILARNKKMSDETYNKILEVCKQKGFDITQLKKTDQSCIN